MVARHTPSETSDDETGRRDDRRWAALGGVIAAIVGFGTLVLVGTASSIEARRLLDSILPTVRFVCEPDARGIIPA